jgi:mono/diheme cytochrome c family protein
MLKQKSLWMLGAMIVVALAMYAEDQPQKVIKHVPVKPTSAASGSEMYKAYCAVCHGLDGRGRGPAADALKVPPTDLTSLAKNNGGKYPALRVTSSVRGEANTPAHGTAEMPVWGHLFRSMSGGHDAEVQQRVANLTEYIEGMQAK